MPGIDRTADIAVRRGPGCVAAEIPLTGHADEYWLALFAQLAQRSGLMTPPEAEDREDRSWVIVKISGGGRRDRPEVHPGAELEDARALVSQVNVIEQSGAVPTEAAIRTWCARQRR